MDQHRDTGFSWGQPAHASEATSTTTGGAPSGVNTAERTSYHVPSLFASHGAVPTTTTTTTSTMGAARSPPHPSTADPLTRASAFPFASAVTAASSALSTGTTASIEGGDGGAGTDVSRIMEASPPVGQVPSASPSASSVMAAAIQAFRPSDEEHEPHHVVADSGFRRPTVSSKPLSPPRGEAYRKGVLGGQTVGSADPSRHRFTHSDDGWGEGVGDGAAGDRRPHNDERTPSRVGPIGFRTCGSGALNGRNDDVSRADDGHTPAAAAGRPGGSTSGGGGALLCPSPTSTVDYAEIEQKQIELRHAVDYRISSLERSLALREEEVTQLQGQLRKLEEDYQFNYNLIAERDAALEEAAMQLQRLYRELKRVTGEASTLEKKVDAAESEAATLRQRVRDVEAERDANLRQLQKEYAVKEKHVLETVREKELALEEERQRDHTAFLERLKALDADKAETASRTALLTSQFETRYEQATTRLQEELNVAQTNAASLREERQAVAEALAAREQQLHTLQQEHSVLQQRYRAATEEAAEVRRALEAKLTQSNVQAEKSLALVEDAIRAESQKAAALELEKTSLVSQLAALQERLQQCTTRLDEEMTRHAAESGELRQRYTAAQEAMSTVQEQWQAKEKQLHDAIHAATTEKAAATAARSRAEDELTAVRQQHEHTRHERDKLQSEVGRLTSDVARWKDEEARTAAKAREDASAAEERQLALERAVQTAKDESERHKRKAFDAQERGQSEVARLTRELHASEAARRALEDQFHLLQEGDGKLSTIQQLRFENQTLHNRVLELEKTNEEIRQQVANFTLELQNDPLVRAAKDTQRRLEELQRELLEARGDQQRLRDALQEKSEELAKLQVEVLQARMVLGTTPSSSSTVHPAGGVIGYEGMSFGAAGTAAPSQLLAELREMRAAYTALSKAVGRQQRQRRHRYRHKQNRTRSSPPRTSSSASAHSSRSPSAPVEVTTDGYARKANHANEPIMSSSASSTSSSPLSSSRSSSSFAGEKRAGRRARHEPTHHHHSRARPHRTKHARHQRRPRSAPPLPPSKGVAGPSNEATQRSAHAGYLEQEAEAWRRKCLQLEQHIGVVLRERDRLRKELEATHQEVHALTSEKQSLLDLNSLLKAQLREAYRAALEAPQRGTARASASTTPPAAASSPEALAAAALATLLQQRPELLQSTSLPTATADSRSPRSSRPYPVLTSSQEEGEVRRRDVRLPSPATSPPRNTVPVSRELAVDQMSTNHYAASSPSHHRRPYFPPTTGSPPRTSPLASKDAPSPVASVHAAVGGRSPAYDRLAALEEEIEAVREQIATTTALRRENGNGRRGAAPVGGTAPHASQRVRSSANADPIVVRSGVGAVRHYGRPSS